MRKKADKNEIVTKVRLAPEEQYEYSTKYWWKSFLEYVLF